MNTKFLTCAAFAAIAVASTAQITEEAIMSDPFFAAGSNHVYHAVPDTDTPAPKGYKPVYISHASRHGSRYLTGRNNKWDSLLSRLDSCNNRGLLTETGKELLDSCKALVGRQQGHVGHLASLGGREHKSVAERMYERFKPVWTNGKRNLVVARSTDYPRCISSMCWSTSGLKGKNPGLEMTFDSSEESAEILRVNVDMDREANRSLEKKARENFENVFDASYFYGKVFTDPEAAAEITLSPCSFCNEVYDLWKGAQCAGMDGFDAGKYFSVQELALLLRRTSDRVYELSAGAAKPGNPAFHVVDKLLDDIVKEIDAAIEGNEICAHLRYTHDSAMLPLLFKLNLEGYCGEWDGGQCHKHWDTTHAMPMCSNLQIILYTAKTGAPLVKMLVNETERSINSLTPVRKHYYKWSDVKEMIENRNF